jgi:hypothetical protein
MNGIQEMELWLGPSHNGGSSFESDEHRREVWFRYRDQVMRRWGKNGKRPYAWWRYESPFPSRRHPGVHEQSILYEFTDALGEDERAELEAFWRKEFDKTWREGFSCYHEKRIFSGDVARELHWLWADIAPPYLDKLLAERERRGQVIRELQEESQQEETVAETGNR